MNNSNYMQIVPDSQFYDSLEQIKWAVQRLRSEFIHFNPDNTQVKEFDYVIKVIENTIEKYKLIEK